MISNDSAATARGVLTTVLIVIATSGCHEERRGPAPGSADMPALRAASPPRAPIKSAAGERPTSLAPVRSTGHTASGTARATASGAAAAETETATGTATTSARVPAAAQTDTAPSASGKRGLNTAPSGTKPPQEEVGRFKGKQQVEGHYAVWFQSAGRYTVGQPAAIQAVLVAKGEYHCNEKYPHKVKLGAAPAGLSYPAPTARGAAVTPRRTTLAVPFTPSQPGVFTLNGVFHFSVCNASSCRIEKRPLSLAVKVHEPG